VAQSFRSLILDHVGSTNREAFALAEAGVSGPLWIMARRQSAGRGRSDRQWVSAPGNLHASLLICLDCPATAVAQLSLLAGVAAIDAIRRAAVAGGGVEPIGLRLKWPNDILIDGAKCAGILVETSGAFPGRRRVASRPPSGEGPGMVGGTPTLDVLQSSLQSPSLSATRVEGTLSPPSSSTFTAVIGVGIDLAWHPTAMHRAATDLAAHGCRIEPEAMLASLAEAMQHWLGVWDSGSAFHSIRAAWLERAGPVGEMCTVDTGRERIAGAFADLDPNGALIICDSDGRRRVVTFGDVALDGTAAGTHTDTLAGPASKEVS
jgi:BirA family biotin operon repressor/biotin-[acetyl-CoA-carboxylase] ligase